MTAFLRVFTWAVPVASVSRRLVPVGSRVDRLAGGQRDRQNGQVVELAIVTAPMSGPDADALEGILDGLAHAFPMDASLFAFSGLGPASFTATISAVQSKHGGNSASITVAVWVVDFIVAPAVWTIALWRWSGAAWVHYFVRSDGAKWIDGVRNDATATAWLTFDTALGVITITGSPTFYDDVLFAPFKVSEGLVAALFSWNGTNALPDMRALTYDGNIFENSEAKVMRAYDVEGEVVQHANDSADPGGDVAWDPAGRALRFRLVEVLP